MEERDTSPVGFVVETFQDLVAKLKQKERELEELKRLAEQRADASEHYNEYILQSVPSGVVSFGQDLFITRVNAAAGKILEIVPAEAVGKRFGEVFRDPLKTLLEDRVAVQRSDLTYVAPSGKKLHLGYTLTPLKNEEGQAIGQLLVFSDLTELKALESQAVLRDRLSSLGEMAAGVAHELRNPMGVIAGYVKLLEKKSDASSAHILASVSREIAVMDRIITDFLSFARPTEINAATVDLGGLLGNCVDYAAGGRGDIIVSARLKGMPPVFGDEILLRQAFSNIIQNAVEAMPSGGTLTLDFSSREEGTLEVTVSDTGHGIPESIRDKIFLPFYTTKERGTGLGLAIVHKIVVSHRGALTVESTERGTTIRVRLPRRS
jgi:two-component system sensor histidine kinase PilS (NtrC family)